MAADPVRNWLVKKKRKKRKKKMKKRKKKRKRKLITIEEPESQELRPLPKFMPVPTERK
jgi:hypothetical protein